QSAAATEFDEMKALADQGDADAQVNLGVMYDVGDGVQWYRKAADQGYARAQFKLGVMYAVGEGVPENDAEAVKWYRKAAEQGLAESQFELGVMYAVGEGVPVPEFIIPWFSEEGAPNNNTRAYVWWSVAKTQGHAQAATNIDKLKPKMTPQQIADGQALAAKCYESNYTDCD
ncbi:sel1 repeat family protein, partial [Porticoccaceae bacterium]|nr:sel1 repeat family protein [Porticoccaceae bacterium]